MKIIRDRGEVDMEKLLKKSLFAHLATVEENVPRDSPVWFLWEEGKLWIIGDINTDSFPRRIEAEPQCALGIVEYDQRTGKVIHIGFRGAGEVVSFDQERANRLLTRYLGAEQDKWDPRFTSFGKTAILISITPETVVVRDQSYKVLE
ncbi:pyridoxamine 5'-phosphate oxidase family protein [Alkalihalophilus marmarensis]|uniref:Pyridoxamine 5-phosphate oxidase n=1 Tax=Alkalihalophilus marmarensis DSM 21297 TaxID=1188261 RepID=U6SVF7_9BACI|nr:pyridoxamine 5'-phosphate oxidase family protein [Alkalihalophilus marmarensis]ERN54661.1 pyridoxamine 5-phosphate oxidase [Alkalihalophilus marmarensis DSM 21297]MCM3488720.1 pyridoxamine 5'-phosphate oxidase family protein [Alkalihalophilus marmarensis]